MKECTFSPRTRFSAKSCITTKDAKEFYNNKMQWKSSVDLKNRELKVINISLFNNILLCSC